MRAAQRLVNKYAWLRTSFVRIWLHTKRNHYVTGQRTPERTQAICAKLDQGWSTAEIGAEYGMLAETVRYHAKVAVLRGQWRPPERMPALFALWQKQQPVQERSAFDVLAEHGATRRNKYGLPIIDKWARVAAKQHAKREARARREAELVARQAEVRRLRGRRRQREGYQMTPAERKKREMIIVRMVTKDKLSYAQVGELMMLSRARVHQIYDKYLEKKRKARALKRPSRAKKTAPVTAPIELETQQDSAHDDRISNDDSTGDNGPARVGSAAA